MNESAIQSLTIGARITVDLVLNRFDLLPSQYTHSVLEAVRRLGDHRFKSALAVQRAGI